MNCSNYKALFSQIVFKKEGWNQKASILLKLSVIYANGRVEQVIWLFKNNLIFHPDMLQINWEFIHCIGKSDIIFDDLSQHILILVTF